MACGCGCGTLIAVGIGAGRGAREAPCGLQRRSQPCSGGCNNMFAPPTCPTRCRVQTQTKPTPMQGIKACRPQEGGGGAKGRVVCGAVVPGRQMRQRPAAIFRCRANAERETHTQGGGDGRRERERERGGGEKGGRGRRDDEGGIPGQKVKRLAAVNSETVARSNANQTKPKKTKKNQHTQQKLLVSVSRFGMPRGDNLACLCLVYGILCLGK